MSKHEHDKNREAHHNARNRPRDDGRKRPQAKPHPQPVKFGEEPKLFSDQPKEDSPEDLAERRKLQAELDELERLSAQPKQLIDELEKAHDAKHGDGAFEKQIRADLDNPESNNEYLRARGQLGQGLSDAKEGGVDIMAEITKHQEAQAKWQQMNEQERAYAAAAAEAVKKELATLTEQLAKAQSEVEAYNTTGKIDETRWRMFASNAIRQVAKHRTQVVNPLMTAAQTAMKNGQLK